MFVREPWFIELSFHKKIFVFDKNRSSFYKKVFMRKVSLVMTNKFCCFCCSSSSERKSTWAKQIISSWVKGFSFEDRVFSMCTTACFTNLFWQNISMTWGHCQSRYFGKWTMLTQLGMMWKHCSWMWSRCTAVCPSHGSLPDQLASSVVGSCFLK